MNYFAHYERLISRASGRILDGYAERHHVIPKCMGGGNSASNIVSLTAEEHYVAHQLLVKMHPGVSGLATAAVRMSKQCTGNKAYAWLRKRHATAVSARSTGNKHNIGRVRPKEERDRISRSMTGIKKTQETKEKMSIAQRGNQKSKGLIRGPQSADHKKKNGDSKRGIPLSEEHKAKISEAKMGKTKSDETRLRMSIAQRERHKKDMLNE